MPASSRPGMGAVPYDGGTTFRVWAPFATSVAAMGSFNGWSNDAAPMYREGGGYWSCDAPRAKPGDEYKFSLVGAYGDRLSKNDPYAHAVTSSNGNSVICPRGIDCTVPGYVMPPWNELVIYELHVGTFSFDPESPAQRGTFRSLVEKLDALVDLGVNAIEVMAAGEFPTDVSWGFNPSYIFAIESSYGGPEQFAAFVRAAHERGIAVILDVVYNHLGPGDLDLWQYDGWNENGGGGIYFYNDWRRWTPWGDTRPDYGRPEVRQYLRDNAIYWLEERGVDGLRWDATGYIRNAHGRNGDTGADLAEGWAFLQDVNREIGERSPGKISIAEDMQGNAWVARPVSEGGAGFDAQWDASFLHPVRQVLTEAEDADRSMSVVADAITAPDGWRPLSRVIYIESHDEVIGHPDDPGKARMPVAIDPASPDGWFARKRASLGAAMVFTSPGIPLIFQGEEFYDEAPFEDSVLLDWEKRASRGYAVSLHRDLIRLRRNFFDTTRGLRGENVNVHHVNHVDKIVAFHRWERGGSRDDTVVVLNFANRSYDAYRIGMPRAGMWRVRFNSDAPDYGPDVHGTPGYDTHAERPGKDGMPASANIGIGPYSAIILSQD